MSYDLSPVVLPGRSLLIGLEPRGLNTGRIESVWSYLHRLAEAHAVRFSDLLCHLLDAQKMAGASVRSDYGYFGKWKDLARGLRHQACNERLVPVLEKMTCRTDLAQMTLSALHRVDGIRMPWAGSQAWCPDCLASDDVPYERAYWRVAGITHCAVHQCELQTVCAECGKPQRAFAANSSIRHCVECGVFKSQKRKEPEKNGTPEMALAVHVSTELTAMLEAASNGVIGKDSRDIRDHNLRVCASIETVGGVTGLSKLMGRSRRTCLGWLEKHEARMVDIAAWSWVTSCSAVNLLSRRIERSEVCLRPLPSGVSQKAPRKTPVPPDSTILYRTVLQLGAENPFRAPRLQQLEQRAGVHLKHPAFQDPQYQRLIQRLRRQERVFTEKVRIWREVTEIHVAVLELVAAGKRWGRSSVAASMRSNPGRFGCKLARGYLNWMRTQVKRGNQGVLKPKKIPLDVRAYWDWQKSKE